MQQIFQSTISGFNYIMALPEHLIEPLEFLPEFVKEPMIESLNLVPFLFVIFVLIEVLERYFTKKKHLFVFFMKKIGPLFGSIFASIPQCGFSVIASTLYTRRILSRGTLLAVYFATSDESIPVLMSNPSKVYLVVPIIILKIIIAVIVGYLVDILVGYKASEPIIEEKPLEVKAEGCCHHKLADAAKTKEFWWHPVKHTFNIFAFILVISLILSALLHQAGTEENLAKYCLMNSPLQPMMASLIGLIPNCASSVLITQLYLQGAMSFGAMMAGLLVGAGVGILVLFRVNENKRESLELIAILYLIGIIAGIILNILPISI